MLRALTLYHLHTPHLIKIIIALLLITPSATEAADDCPSIIKNQILPIDAELFLAPTKMQMNGPVFCLVGFGTGLQPERLIQLYEDHWSNQAGQMDVGRDQLLLKGPTRSHHLRVIAQSHAGSTATLSVMALEPASMRLKKSLSEALSDMEIIHAQQSQDGQTVMVKARWHEQPLLHRLMGALTAAGWQSDSAENNSSNPDARTLSRGGDLLNVTTGIQGHPDLALIQLITPTGAP